MSFLHPVIIHYHIFKNAGTTFAETLVRNFRDEAIDPDKISNPDEKMMPSELQKIIESYGKKIESFTSHRLILPPPISSSFRPLSVVLLRHPVDRAVSSYYFWRRWKDSPRMEAKLAQKQNLGEYFEEFDNPKRLKFFLPYKNEQTRFASRFHKKVVNADDSAITQEDFEKAWANLKLCFFVGETDMYSASMVVLEEKLKPYFPNIDLSYVRKNVTVGRKDTLDNRLEDAKRDLGEDLFYRMVKSNEFDLKLVRMNRQLLNEQIKQITNFEEKLNDFRRRCTRLETKKSSQ